MTPTDLERIGAALYGPRWQSDLARDLNVADRTVRRWAAGERSMPAGLVDEMRVVLRGRRAAIDALLDRLTAAVERPPADQQPEG